MLNLFNKMVYRDTRESTRRIYPSNLFDSGGAVVVPINYDGPGQNPIKWSGRYTGLTPEDLGKPLY